MFHQRSSVLPMWPGSVIVNVASWFRSGISLVEALDNQRLSGWKMTSSLCILLVGRHSLLRGRGESAQLRLTSCAKELLLSSGKDAARANCRLAASQDALLSFCPCDVTWARLLHLNT